MTKKIIFLLLILGLIVLVQLVSAEEENVPNQPAGNRKITFLGVDKDLLRVAYQNQQFLRLISLKMRLEQLATTTPQSPYLHEALYSYRRFG